MTFSFFVESKFIPEHVAFKTLSGQIHYQAMLKHLLRPETVNRIFNPEQIENARLKTVADWPYLEEVRLCDINPDHVRRIVTSAFARGYSSQTVKHIRNVLFAIITHAQREGCFSGSNPVLQIKLPPIAHKIAQNLTISQTKSILELMQHPDKEIALFTIMTGMTIVEICELRWRHVNLGGTSRHIDGEVIPPESIAVRTCWNRSGLGVVNQGRNRNILLHEPLLSHLRDLSRQDPRRTPDDPVVSSKQGEPIPPMSIRMSRLAPIGQKLGISWLSWQALRRAHTTLLAEFRNELNDQFISKSVQTPVNKSSEFGRTIECDAPVQSGITATVCRPSFCFGRRSLVNRPARRVSRINRR
jgi:integrase